MKVYGYGLSLVVIFTLPFHWGCAVGARPVDPGADDFGLLSDGEPLTDTAPVVPDFPWVKRDKGAPDKPAPKLDKGPPPKLDKGIPPKLDKGIPPKLDKGIPPKLDKGVPPGPQVLYWSNFEQNNGGLKAWGDWQWGVLAFKADINCDAASTMSPPPKPRSGARVWGTRLNGCYSAANNAQAACKNANPGDDSILRVGVQIPPGNKTAVLEWWEWTDYFKDFDWTEVRINGKVVAQDCTGGHKKPSAWVKRSINLNGYIGKFVGVEFHFMATSVVNLSGWYLDDLKIWAQK